MVLFLENAHSLKLKTFGPKSFGKKTSDKKLSDTFSGISDKETFKQARYQKDVKTECDSIINFNLQKVHGDHHMYKDT